ncbi:MAG: hypothetical protein H0V17_04980 [Deltaproteobacteria bacterium]|nr:hypothetical protein [Deltaproteobacteria bacterium]
MMKTAFGITLLVGTGVAFAQPKEAPKKDAPKEAPAPAPMAKPTPAKELDATKDWQKTWACTATNDGGEKVLGKLALKKELEGFWVGLVMSTQKTKTMPAFLGQAVFGVDPVSKAWVMTGYDNMGGWINMKGKEATAISMIWEGEAGNMSGKKVPAKFTMTLADKKKLKFIGEFGGKKAFEHDCK